MKTKIKIKTLTQQLKELKKLAAEHRILGAKVTRMTTKLFIYTYTYIAALVAQGKVKNRTGGLEMLSGPIGEKMTTLKGWYTCGKYIRDNNLTVSAHCGSVRAAAMVKMKKEDKSRILVLIRKGAHPGRVAAYVKALRLRSGALAESRIKALRRKGNLTRITVKLEAHVLLKLANAVYGDNCRLIIEDADYKKVVNII